MIRFFLAALILCAAPLASAQTISTGLERELTLSLNPQQPSPGQTVQLSITSFAIDLNRAGVIWYANDKEIARGDGLTTAAVVTGNAGKETRIRVIAEEGGIVASAETTIHPTEVDLLWEADSYVPPYYTGRVLPGTNANIRAQALARFMKTDGSRIPERDIVYTWYRNSAKVASGRGKSIVTIPGPELFSASTIRVVAESADRAYSGEAGANIPSTDPFILLYENHPLFGVLYHRALNGGANTLETELKLTAVPYFTRARSPHDAGFSYAWRANDIPITADQREPETLTLTTGGYEGPMDIALELTNSNDIAMRAAGAWRLTFGTESGLFGGSGGFNPFSGQQ